MTAILVLLLVGATALAAAAFVTARRARAAAALAAAAREAAEHDAVLAEGRRRRAFLHLPLAAVRVDSGHRLVEVNDRALRLFPHLLPGMGVLEAFGEHRLAEQVADVLAGGEASAGEVRLFSGGRRTFRIAVEPVPAEAGREALVFMADLSEAVAYQELRSQFVANVSHELRTPLTGLRGLVEALDDPDMDPGTHARFVARAAAEIQRLEALITDILFLSELEATQGLPAEGRSDLAAAMAATAEALAGEATAQRVTVSASSPGPAWTPLTEAMARTVVRNLLENAIRYAGAGANVRVSVGHVPGGEVELVVADDGAGIPERHLPHVFERFYRADPSRSKRLGGTGLGLSIVKHIAERFGGNAVAESREGFGTVVRVVVPGVAEDAPAAGEAPAAPAPAAAGVRPSAGGR